MERFGNNVSSSQRIQGILKPDGKLIGAVKGTDKSIRTVSKDKFDDVVNQLQEIKVKPVDKPNYKGQWYEAVDGKGGFGIRNSDKNGTTIDLNFPDVSNKAIKIHYKP